MCTCICHVNVTVQPLAFMRLKSQNILTYISQCLMKTVSKHAQLSGGCIYICHLYTLRKCTLASDCCASATRAARGAAAGEYLIRIFVNIPYLAMFNIISETLLWVEYLSMLAICKGDTFKIFEAQTGTLLGKSDLGGRFHTLPFYVAGEKFSLRIFKSCVGLSPFSY